MVVEICFRPSQQFCVFEQTDNPKQTGRISMESNKGQVEEIRLSARSRYRQITLHLRKKIFHFFRIFHFVSNRMLFNVKF